MRRNLTSTAAVALVLCGPSAGQDEIERPSKDAFVWSVRQAEHLLNRAGFGAGSAEIEGAVETGHRSFVAELLRGEPLEEEPFYSTVEGKREYQREKGSMSLEERRAMKGMVRENEREQLGEFLAWWVERMVAGEDALRERMTLFWHGHFTSSMEDVRDSYEMILQNQFLRENALGSFRDLLHGIARDPAMLEYLDNDSNKKGKPNENFARELMELFTLGEGNYTELDVKEAARAFTGWTDRGSRFRYDRKRHDAGEKTVLGVTGKLNGDGVLDILLEQPACSRYLTGKLLRYFEGVAPDEERLAEYAAALWESDYDVAAFLEKLFLDPEFYREAVVGNRIASPIDYLVGSARRLGLDPPPRLVVLGSTIMGERLFYPPNVKGWEGGEAWVTTASLMQRGNLAGVMLGQVTIDDFLSYDPLQDEDLDSFLGDGDGDGDMGSAAEDPGARRRNLGQLRGLKGLREYRWRARINLTARMKRAAARSDGKIVRTLLDDLLAVEADRETRRSLKAFLADEREALGIKEGKLLADPAVSEPLLRKLSHVILSLPEAQLN